MRSIPWRIALVGMLVLPPAAGGQVEPADAVPRLPWNAPDLQGIWLRQSSSPLERDAAVADRAVLTPVEAAAYLAERHAAINRYLALDLNADWPSLGGLTDRRTSLIVSPPNGRLPARTPAGQRRAETLGRGLRARGADGPEDREYFERCIMGRSVPFVAPSWDERLQIFQTPDHVAIHDETGELRLVPVTLRAPLPRSIRQWTGDSRGRWEGDTLVIETSHFNGKWTFHGAGPTMRLVERFTRVSAVKLDYQFTVHDSESFAGPWTAAFPFTLDPGPLYEAACHEGNYSMSLMLGVARARERDGQGR